MRVQLDVSGKLKLNPDGRQVRALPLLVHANLSYDERPRPSDAPLLAVRHYRQAEATIRVGKTELRRKLSEDKRLIGVRRQNGRLVLYCPRQPLSRDELDLVDVQGNSLLLPQLLPGRPLEVEQKWSHDDQLLAQLLGLEAVSRADVTSHVVDVDSGTAVVELAGTVSGAAGGVASEIELKGKYNVNLQSRRVTWLALAIKEDRSIGHAEPGFQVMAQLRVAVSPLQSSEALGDAALAQTDLSERPGWDYLGFQSGHGHFGLLHDRRWHVMIDQPQVTILRLVDRGDLIAQCNISRLADLPPGEHLPMQKFQIDVQRSLGEQVGQLSQASESTERGLHLLRVTADGVVSDLPIHWIYYHVTDQQGRRVSCVFTMESKYLERFGAADQALVSSLSLMPAVDSSGGSSGAAGAAATTTQRPAANGPVDKR